MIKIFGRFISELLIDFLQGFWILWFLLAIVVLCFSFNIVQNNFTLPGWSFLVPVAIGIGCIWLRKFLMYMNNLKDRDNRLQIWFNNKYYKTDPMIFRDNCWFNQPENQNYVIFKRYVPYSERKRKLSFEKRTKGRTHGFFINKSRRRY